MNLSEKTKLALFEIIKQCYDVNRVLDRMVSVLKVDFGCETVSELVHEQIAHKFPFVADVIGEKCLERYGVSVSYGSTPAATENYESFTSLMDSMEALVVEFQNMFIGLNKVALENNDFHIFADLQDVMEDLNVVVEQVGILNSKAKQYGDDRIAQMDNAVKGFWILNKEE